MAIDASHWIATQQTSVWATDDAGANWRLLTDRAGPGSIDTLSFADLLDGWTVASPGCGEIACPPNRQSGAGVYATEDGGTHWAELNLPSD